MIEVWDQPSERIALAFGRRSAEGGPQLDLSAVVAVGDDLWLASDEGAVVHTLVRADDGHGYGQPRAQSLGTLFDLPGGAGEMDIEGLAVADGHLWVVGSHSRRRKRARSVYSAAKNIDRLADLPKHQPNRDVLARIPIVVEDGRRQLDADGAAWLKTRKSGRGALVRLLDQDPHLEDFFGIPAKENGFDVEGLAVRAGVDGGARVLLGLRGPVLRGIAILLELHLSARRGRLEPAKIGADGRRYRKHFLDLGGLGVRELCLDGDDLLILAGPSMAADGPIRVFRWGGWTAAGEADSFTPRGELRQELAIPHGRDDDRPEGITLLDGRSKSLLVLPDSPAPWRLGNDGTVLLADVFSLTGPQ